MSRRTVPEPSAESVAAPAAQEPPMGDVVPMKPRRQRSQHPEAVRARRRRREQRASSMAPAPPARPTGQPPERTPGRAAGRATGQKPAHAAGHGEHPVVIAVLFVFCALAAAGTFVMAQDTLAGMYPGIGASVRALGLVGCELAFGHGAYALIRAGRTGAGLACGAIVLLCALAEIGLASTQGEIASRTRQDKVLKEDLPTSAPAATEVPTSIEGGPKKAQEILEAAAQARHEAQERADKQAAAERAEREKTRAERLKLATQQTWIEWLLPGVLALLGALAAACTTPLLELLIASLRRRPVGAS